MANPYDVERTWPDLFLEERTYAAEKQGTYKASPHPVWTVHVPDGWIGNSTIIEGHDGLIVYDTSIGAEATTPSSPPNWRGSSCASTPTTPTPAWSRQRRCVPAATGR